MPIRAIAGVLPEWSVENDIVAEWAGLKPDFVANKIGVRRRNFLRADEDGVGLATAACRKLFQNEPELDAGSIGLLVYVTQNPDYRLPHSSALLQNELGLDTGVAAFDINLGCSGFVYALTVVEAMMEAQAISDALLVTCDPYSKVMRRSDRNVIGVFGDGATATWMSRASGARIGKADFGTDGAGAQHLIVRGGGTNDLPSGVTCVESETEGQWPYVEMNGRAVFNFVVSNIPNSVEKCLVLNGLQMGDIDCFLMHQGSRFMLEALRDRMKIPVEKMLISLEMTGNLVSSSIPYILADLLQENEPPPLILISGFGVGLSWATNVIYVEGFDDD